MRILVIGDFSGHAGGPHNRPNIAERRPIPIELERFDEVMARLKPRIAIPTVAAATSSEELEFAALDDFHPDMAFRRLRRVADLRILRDRLLDPTTFSATATALQSEAAATLPAAPPDKAKPEDDSTTFSRLLGRPLSDQARGRPVSGAASEAVDRLIAQIIAPHVVQTSEPEQSRLVAAVDGAIADTVRAVLHSSEWQALESAWRGLARLARNLDTGGATTLFVFDASREEIVSDLSIHGGRAEDTELKRAVVGAYGQGWGGEPWSMIVADFMFGAGEEDVRLMAALATIGQAAGGPIVAAASATVLGCQDLVATPDPRDWQSPSTDAAERWQGFRRSAAACWIGLALPRVMLRIPYGARTDPIESFAFEEIADPRDHACFLWGNPGFAVAFCAAAGTAEITDLPAYSYRDGEGESRLLPCAEVCLSERAVETVLAKGVMPLVSHRHRNIIRLARLQSLAERPHSLVPWWG